MNKIQGEVIDDEKKKEMKKERISSMRRGRKL